MCQRTADNSHKIDFGFIRWLTRESVVCSAWDTVTTGIVQSFNHKVPSIYVLLLEVYAEPLHATLVGTQRDDGLEFHGLVDIDESCLAPDSGATVHRSGGDPISLAWGESIHHKVVIGCSESSHWTNLQKCHTIKTMRS